MGDLADYIVDNYGSCRLGSAACECLKTGWLGRICPNWNPTKAKTWVELSKEQDKLYEKTK